MNRFRSIFFLIALAGLWSCSCYTSLHAPRVASEEEGSELETWQQVPVNPSIPAAHASDFDWVYYYQLPWWMDESEAMLGGGAPGMLGAPGEYRQRYPENPDYSGSYSGSYSPAVTAPSLGKQPADSSQPSQTAPAQDNRRSFSAGSTTDTQATVPAASSTPPGSERRGAETPSSAPSGREQPKRR